MVSEVPGTYMTCNNVAAIIIIIIIVVAANIIGNFLETNVFQNIRYSHKDWLTVFPMLQKPPFIYVIFPFL